MDANFGKQSQALIAFLTELNFQPVAAHASPLSSQVSDPSDEQICLNHLATICAEAWNETFALTWTGATTHVNLVIASTLSFPNPSFEIYIKGLWDIICEARTQYKLDQGRDMSDSVDQVKNKVFPCLENWLRSYLDECRSDIGSLSSPDSPDTFVNEAIKVIIEENRSTAQVRDFFDNVCRHAEGWKSILSAGGNLHSLDGLINRISDLNAAMKGLVDLFVKLTEPINLNALNLHLLNDLPNGNTTPFQREDWFRVARDARLRVEYTPVKLHSAITRLSNAQHHNVPAHPALVLYTYMRSIEDWEENAKWNIGSRSKICRACAEYILMDNIHYRRTSPGFQRNNGFAYPWALPSMSTWDDKLRKDFYYRIAGIVCGGEADYYSDYYSELDDDSPCDEILSDTPSPQAIDYSSDNVGKLDPLPQIDWQTEGVALDWS